MSKKADDKQTAATRAEAGDSGSSGDIGFSDAMAELEAILERIEGEEIDIDRLAEELGRAAELLETCRGKIRRAEVEVTQIVQSLEDSESEAGDDDAEEEAEKEAEAEGGTGDLDWDEEDGDDDIPF